VELKRVTDLTVSPLIQRALEAYANVGLYQSHLRRSGRLYRRRRDVLLAAIRRYLPPAVHVDPPQGGMFAWLRLPAGLSCLDLLEAGAETGVEFAPGTRFFPAPVEGEAWLRLNFATQPPEQIEEGIKRLARAMDLCQA
jgi:GntR family transcriptional regulator/MocR family aminotransferase